MKYATHPAAELFPMMSNEQYAGLKRDIAAHGQREPIVLYEGKILDGCNRYRACRDLKLEPEFCEYDEDVDPVQYVLSANLQRRHLNESQRAMIAGRIANLKNGGDRKSDQSANLHSDSVTIEDAGDLLSVSRRSVADARSILEHGCKELIAAVDVGEAKVSRAAKVAKSSPPEIQMEELAAPSRQPAASLVEKLQKLWAKCDDDERRKFMDWIQSC